MILFHFAVHLPLLFFTLFVAVDAHVGQHLFEQCIMNLKKRNKCIILVTNALQFLKNCSQIIVLRDGLIVESGKYDYLLLTGFWLNEMIRTHLDSSNSSTLSKNTSQIEETTDVDIIPDKITNSLKNTENQNNLNPVDIDEKLKIKLKNGDTKDSKVGLVTEPVKQVSLNVLVTSGRLLSVEEKEVGDVSIKV